MTGTGQGGGTPYDLVIVGSGPAGWACLSSCLEALEAAGAAGRGARIAVLESGPAQYQGRDDNGIGAPDLVGQPFRLSPTTASALGGTSHLWHGIAAPLDPIDFSPRDYITEARWPIGLDDLAPWYAHVAGVLGWDAHLLAARHQPEALARMTARAGRAGNAQTPALIPKLFLQPDPVFRAGPAIAALAAAYPGLEVLTEHHVLEVQAEFSPDHPQGRVTGVLAGRPDGQQVAIPARQVVLCTGALQTPRILMNSMPEWHRRHPGPVGHLGRYLMDHPMGSLFQVDHGAVARRRLYLGHRYGDGRANMRAALRLDEATQRAHGLPNTAFYLRPIFRLGEDDVTEETKLALLALPAKLRRGRLPLAEAMAVARRPGLAAQILQYKFGLDLRHRYAQGYVISEQRPNPASQVRLGARRDRWGRPMAEVHWQILDRDFADLERFYGLIAPHFTVPYPPDFTRWRTQLSSAAHHLGTCRMAARPEDGVVDASHAVFGLKGLAVADGSVFVTGGNANATFTIMALAARAGHILAGQMQTGRTCRTSQS